MRQGQGVAKNLALGFQASNSQVNERVKPVNRLQHDQAPVLDDDKNERWDGTSVHTFQGTYGDYVLGKVSKVFPQLSQDHID